MKIYKVFRIFFSYLLIIVLIGGCTFPATTSDDFEIHFGRPSNGDVIMVGESFSLLANGYSLDEDVSRVLFFANGRVVGEAPNAAGENITASYLWEPTEAGEYTLQIAAQRGREYVYSQTISVCVLPFQIAPGHPYDIYAHGYEGDCLIPDRSGSAAPGTPTMTTVSASPQILTYIPLYYDLCPDQTRFIDFKVYIDDPHDDVIFAVIALNLTPALMGRINGETTLALTHIGNTPPHTKLFVGEIDMHIFLTRSLTNPASGAGSSGDLNWSARAFGRDGEILIEEGPFTIPTTPIPCDGSPIPTITLSPISTSESMLTPQLTATPASSLDCPPGTYFSENTHKCYTIVVPTKKPDNDNTCSQYVSDSECNASGCTYNYNKKSCEP